MVMGGKRPVECEHGNRFQTEAELRPPLRAPLARVSEKRQAEIDAGERPRTGSTLKRGRGFAVAEPQRRKIRGRVCVGCGREIEVEDPNWTIDPAHLLPRGVGGCDSELCVVPLCRHRFDPDAGCHCAYDEGKLDILPALLERGYHEEIAHMIAPPHKLSPLTVVVRLTGEEYAPAVPLIRENELLQARINELEAAGVRA
jgi:hypothetical protein